MYTMYCMYIEDIGRCHSSHQKRRGLGFVITICMCIQVVINSYTYSLLRTSTNMSSSSHTNKTAEEKRRSAVAEEEKRGKRWQLR